jgi:hypothetical protein
MDHPRNFLAVKGMPEIGRVSAARKRQFTLNKIVVEKCM